MKTIATIIGSMLLLSSCGAVPHIPSSTGPVSVGNGEYSIARSEWGYTPLGARVKFAAIKEANEFCENQNSTAEILEASSKDMVPFKSEAQAEIRFRCVDR